MKLNILVITSSGTSVLLEPTLCWKYSDQNFCKISFFFKTPLYDNSHKTRCKFTDYCNQAGSVKIKPQSHTIPSTFPQSSKLTTTPQQLATYRQRMKMDHSFSPLVLSTTALSLTSIFYGLGVLIRSKKKLGIRAVLASIAFQILFWDFLRWYDFISFYSGLGIYFIFRIHLYQCDQAFNSFGY